MISGGSDYNMTTESQFEEMKQRYEELQAENFILKQSLEQLININNQLTNSMDQFNGRNRRPSYRQGSQVSSLKAQVLALSEQLQQHSQQNKYLQDQENIIHVIEELCDSFRLNQEAYEKQLNSIFEQIEMDKKQWAEKLDALQNHYMASLQTLHELTQHLRKKEQIIITLEQKLKKSSGCLGTNDLTMTQKIIRNDETASQRRGIKRESHIKYQDAQQRQFREKENKLNLQLKQKNKIIKSYSELVCKLREKILQN